MTNTELTQDQFNDLKNEFVEFQINEMTNQELVSYVRDVLWTNVEKLSDVELEDKINEYDDNLYDILVPYVLDEDGAYDILQEYIHELHTHDWIDDV